MSGEIPVEISQLLNLEKIRLNHNLFSGCFVQNIDIFCDIDFDFSNNQDLPGTGNFSSFCSNGEGNCERIICNRTTDSLALIALYHATNGDNWKTKWNLNEVIENWHGITTNENGCVIGIELFQNDLIGIIPPEIGDFPNLQKLILYGNQLTGSIPLEVGNLNNLEQLYLHNNQLVDTIPPTIGNLNSLKELRLTNNLLIGEIPPELGNILTLERLYLNQNELTGKLPKELGRLSYLKEIVLEQNQLSDTLPKELGNLRSLQTLYIGYNQLTGEIPKEIGNLRNLSTLDLRKNNLTGNIPVRIFEITSLNQLILSYNKLTGTIPPKFSNIPYLRTLALNNNNLIGSIPAELSKSTNLSYLSLNNNELEGIIPVDLSQLIYLNVISLNNNHLTGEIPQGLGEMFNLSRLFLNDNYLTGSIPEDIGKLRYLHTLHLHNNQLSGCLPQSFLSLCNNSNYNFSNNPNLYKNGDFKSFCNNGQSDCREPVWPGDFNNDGIVNNTDALFWGLACENRPGPQRPNASIEWYGQGSPDWPNAVNNINNKHQDGNGDGFINLADLTALNENYGKESSTAFSTSNTAGVSYRLEPLEITNTSEEASILKYALYVEQGGNPVSLHGLACTINLGNLAISNTPIFDTINSSLAPDQLLLNFNAAENTIDLALTRTDKSNQLCDGPVGVWIIIADHVAVGDPVLLDIKSGHRINADGAFNAVASTSSVSYTSTSDLLVSTTIMHEQCDQLGSAIVNLSDKTLSPSFLWSTGATSSKITNLTAGNYTVIITYANETADTLDIEVEGQFIPIYNEDGELQDCGTTTCTPTLNLINEITTGTKQAATSLTANCIIPTNNNVTFKAGNSITLQAGFTVEAGATFLARIEDCSQDNLNNNNNSRNSQPISTLSNSMSPPEAVSLSIHPSPFSYQTIIEYDLPSAGPVQLIISDMRGRQLKTLVKGIDREGGKHQVTLFADEMESGIYLVSLQTKNGITTSKIILQE